LLQKAASCFFLQNKRKKLNLIIAAMQAQLKVVGAWQKKAPDGFSGAMYYLEFG
jgi:hypothetical protein